MSDYLPFLVVGVTAGSLYGLAGLGLVLTYRTSGVFNFAHGAVAAAAAYLYYQLYVTNGWPWPLAMLATLAVCGAAAGLVLERLARRLVRRQVATIIVGTVGLLLVIQGFLYVRYGALNRIFPDTLQKAIPGGFRLSSVLVPWGQAVTIGISVAAAAGLYAVLRLTRLGVAMRAVVDNGELLDLAGTNPARVRVSAWMLGCSFAALSGILVAPRLGLDAGLLILLIVYSFGAVAIGRFTSLPLTFAGGIAVGILEALATKEFPRPPLNGIPSAVPFLVLIVVLLATPARLLPRHIGRTTALVREARTSLAPARRRAGVAVGLALLIAVPHVAGARLPVYTSALAFVPMFLSLALLVRVSGQISLCQAAFFALGATTFSHLIHDFHLPWLVALVGAGLVTIPLGAVLALPAIRLSGVYLALLTFGFGILMQNVVFGTWLMWGKEPGLEGARPHLGPINGRDEETLYYVFLLVAVVAAFVVAGVVRTRLGRLLRGMADSPLSLATNGLGVNVTKVLVFCLSAFLAGIGGALFLVQATTAGRDTGFGPFQSLSWLAVLVIFAWSGPVASAFLSASFLAVLPAYVSNLTVEWQTLLFGIGVLFAVLFAEVGVPGSLRRLATAPSRSPLRTRPRPAPSCVGVETAVAS
jgi:branched-subunit amino acid ABC-type transport system permease component